MFDSWDKSSLSLFLAATTATLVATLIWLTVQPWLFHDAQEPTIIRPPIPLIGHFLGLAIKRVDYLSTVFKEHKLPIATLPLPNSKLYIIFSAPLQQTAMRAKTMDAQSLTVQYIPRLFGIKKKTLRSLLGQDGVHEDMTAAMLKLFRDTLSGDPLNALAFNALVHVAATLNSIGKDGMHTENLFLWLREVMSHAISAALFGNKYNPYGKGTEVIDAQWDFEAGLGGLVLGFLPSIVARKAYLARKKVQAALKTYYVANRDRDDGVSELVKGRARLFKEWDVSLDELSKNEISIMLAATTNTIPTLFWYIAYVYLRPELVGKLRQEVSNEISGLVATETGPPAATKEITIHYAKLEERCPLLGACYREAIRLASQILALRRVKADTVISDGEGRSYLLKAGNNVLMPAKVVHRNPDTWGADAEGFNPARFLPDPNGDKDLDRLRKVSFVPFGGGKHLCPGRHFPFAENLAFMAALVLGFEVVGLDGARLRMRDSQMGEAAKPEPGFEGGPVTIRRRSGWEGVEYKFEK